jgi:hypothetical protein
LHPSAANEYFAATLTLADAEVSATLVSEGIPLDLAERALAFVPIAFGRRYLADSPPTYSEGYEIRHLESGRIVRGVLANEPLFRLATELAGRGSAVEIARSFSRSLCEALS